MRRSSAILFALFLSSAATAQEAIVGRWDITIHTPDGGLPSWLEIRRSGSRTLVGQFVGVVGSVRPISRVDVGEGQMRFSIPPQWEQGENDMSFEGRLQGDRLTGRMTFPDGRRFDWTANRAPSLRRLTGPTWAEPVRLFNGKDLTGWRLGKADLAGKTATDDGRFAVKDGVLVITGSKDTPPRMSEIDTVGSYGDDFTLRLEFRASRDANSGLHLRDKAFAHQLQIRDYPRVGPYKMLRNYRDGDWNAIEVVVTGTKARCTCNGEPLEAALEIPGKGPLALQSETHVVEYRNVRVKQAK